jgi:hypothetical protein
MKKDEAKKSCKNCKKKLREHISSVENAKLGRVSLFFVLLFFFVAAAENKFMAKLKAF